MLFFDSNTGIEVHYACLDSTRANLILTYLTNIGIPFVGMLSVLTGVLSFFHIDGVAVLAGVATTSIPGATLLAMSNAVSAAVPAYTMSGNVASFTCP